MHHRRAFFTLLTACALSLLACDSDDGGPGDVAGDLTATDASTPSDVTATASDTTTPTDDVATSDSTTRDATTVVTTDASSSNDAEVDSSDVATVPPPPTSGDELAVWLAAGHYESWPAESAPHGSTGPHFGTVRTFVNDALFESLDAGNDAHPPGAAAVKELYGDGDTVLGYAVMVKVDAAATSSGWYWYEGYQGTEYADGTGVSLCSNCHAAGTDHILSPFPLQ